MPTPRLSLPYIVQSQAQKEVTHAEALNVLDALVQAAVETRSLSVPPANHFEGALYLVGVNPTGAWRGRGNMLAQWIGGAWAFRAVAEGFRLWLKDEKTLIIWTDTAWATYPYASAAETLTRTASFAVSPTIGGALYRCDATAQAIIASLPLLADVPMAAAVVRGHVSASTTVRRRAMRAMARRACFCPARRPAEDRPRSPTSRPQPRRSRKPSSPPTVTCSHRRQRRWC